MFRHGLRAGEASLLKWDAVMRLRSQKRWRSVFSKSEV
ncbi:hypothetical protein LBWT_X1040 (plasmid) [Leptolyngbya boryana IAM M-101]|nr:hypothetical protein LBWT_X1040 [Leptolyngbya boryana IAM M-101]BAS66380.1 hypothetical protein LBDG_X1040 [Leptolyngbya boryana dg5]